ncbi:hypothetical protein OUZ56_012718 [Daphnia magna]|uniref:Uncharacterized protein n=1 Tax=Daphnia magna TaxID=35525 RepID=A0ABQ9Z3U3_9CRUS|nr:hypothetical protein OUZ56_012718 [Daphnia magna]
MPINLSWRGDEILARGKNGREKQKGKKGGTEVPTNIHFSMETYGDKCIHIEYKKLKLMKNKLNIKVYSH